MAFNDNLKSEIKKKAHFKCCLCHALGVEAHHILPPNEGGDDSSDNAAPLCPSCHETYGANPQKRKFIREARDFWFDICQRRFGEETYKKLEDISLRLEETVKKDDLKEAFENLLSIISPGKHEDMISISLPSKYWIVILVALSKLVNISIDIIDDMRNRGCDLESVMQLPSPKATALAGPIIARAMIVDELVKNKVMTKSAGDEFGTNLIQKLVDAFKKIQEDKIVTPEK